MPAKAQRAVGPQEAATIEIVADDADLREALPAHAATPARAAQAFDRGPSRRLIERDLGESHRAAYRASLDMRRSAEGQIGGARQASDLARSVGTVAANVATGAKEMVTALTDIRNSSSAISASVARVNLMTASATEKTGLAEKAVDELARVAQEITGVIELVTLIAQQTTMLSHNANIQAARAGEEGRGFAVIAQEVRKLSEDTRAATKTMQQQIAALQAASGSCRDSVSIVAREINQTAAMCGSIDQSAHSQLAGVDQLSASATQRAGDAETLSGQSRALEEIALSSLAAAEQIAGQSSTTDSALAKLHDNLFILTTQTRPHDADDLDLRHPLLLRCALGVDGRSLVGETMEFGLDGALLRVANVDERVEGKVVACKVEHVGTLQAEILRVDRLGVHVQFGRASADTVAAVRRVVSEAHAANRPLVERAMAGAAAISQAMEAALAKGLLSADQLFDQTYKPLPGTDPQQYANAALPVLERILTPIQEEVLATDKRLAFCASVDLNGYLPVHNRRYSQQQRPGDPVWNAANCRNRRIFDDRAGLAAARNTHPHLVQLYARDMGGGKFVMMKESDAPIVVNGRHWGGFRTSYTI